MRYDILATAIVAATLNFGDAVAAGVKSHSKVDISTLKPCFVKDDIEKAISSLPVQTQFQTTDEFNNLKRKAIANALGPETVVERTCVLGDKFRYDANRHSLVTDPYQSSVVYSDEQTLDSYTGSNAYGASAQIKHSLTDLYEIRWPSDLSPNIEIAVNLSAAEAEAAFPNLRLAATLTLVPPYAGHWHEPGHPTISLPYDEEKEEHALYAMPKRFFVFNAVTGKVYGDMPILICDFYGTPRLRLSKCGSGF